MISRVRVWWKQRRRVGRSVGLEIRRDGPGWMVSLAFWTRDGDRIFYPAIVTSSSSKLRMGRAVRAAVRDWAAERLMRAPRRPWPPEELVAAGILGTMARRGPRDFPSGDHDLDREVARVEIERRMRLGDRDGSDIAGAARARAVAQAAREEAAIAEFGYDSVQAEVAELGL